MSKNKLLIILPRFPYPLDKGDKLRAYHQIRYLSKDNDITLFAITHEEIKNEYIDELTPLCVNIHIVKISKARSYWNILKAIFTNMPFQVVYFYDKKIYSDIMHNVSINNYDNVYCQLIRTAEYARDLSINKVIDFQDAFSKNALRRAKGAKNLFERIFFKIEAKRVLRYEKIMCKEFNYTTIITEEDRRLIGKEDIVVVRNGVDFEFFAPQKDAVKKFDVVFTGNMSYHPNVDAAIFLAGEIMDRVRAVRPGTTLLIAGASPTNALKYCEIEHTHISGWIDDIRDAYAEARVFAAPLRMGSGLQNKLLEAMSMNLPCVTSGLANQALKAKEGEEILIAETAQGFADEILKLLNDSDYANEIAMNGRSFVIQTYSWDNETELLNRIFNQYED